MVIMTWHYIFYWMYKLDNSDCGLRLFKEASNRIYNEMEHFWHYFDVIYVKQYFQEKNRFSRILRNAQYCYITKHFVTLASRSNQLGKRTTEHQVHNLMIISLQPIIPLTIIWIIGCCNENEKNEWLEHSNHLRSYMLIII